MDRVGAHSLSPGPLVYPLLMRKAARLLGELPWTWTKARPAEWLAHETCLWPQGLAGLWKWVIRGTSANKKGQVVKLLMFHCRHHEHWLGPDFHTHQHRKGGTGRVWRGRLTSDPHGMLHSLLSPGLKEGCWQWPQSHYPHDSSKTSALFSRLMFCALLQENAMFYPGDFLHILSSGFRLSWMGWTGVLWMPGEMSVPYSHLDALPPGRVGIFLWGRGKCDLCNQDSSGSIHLPQSWETKFVFFNSIERLHLAC